MDKASSVPASNERKIEDLSLKNQAPTSLTKPKPPPIPPKRPSASISATNNSSVTLSSPSQSISDTVGNIGQQKIPYSPSASNELIKNPSLKIEPSRPWVKPTPPPKKSSSSNSASNALSPSLSNPSESVSVAVGNIAQQKLPSAPPLPIEPTGQSEEGQYLSLLRAAKKGGRIDEQILYLEKLAEFYSNKKNFLFGAKILNCALEILQKHKSDPVSEQRLYGGLEKIERQFLEEKRINITNKKANVLNLRNQLKNARQECKNLLASKINIQTIQEKLSNELLNILRTLIVDSQQLFGPPPCKWVCINLSLMDELCPYSKLKIAFMIQEGSEDNLYYFRNLLEFIELRVINFGETGFSLFGNVGESISTSEGFSLDLTEFPFLSGPKPSVWVGTPAHLAQFFQEPNFNSVDIRFLNRLSHVSHIAGEESLIKEYVKEYDKQCKLKEKNETLALKLFGRHSKEFAPDLIRERGETKAIDIEKEIHRPILDILNGLNFFYHLKSNLLLENADELAKKEVFSKEGAKNFKDSFLAVTSLIFQVQFFYSSGREVAFFPLEGKAKDSSLFYMTEENVSQLNKIYKTLIPLHNCCLEFIHHKKKTAFSQNDFCDDNPFAQARSFKAEGRLKQASVSYQQALILNPNDIEGALELGIVMGLLEENAMKQKCARMCLEIAKKWVEGGHLSVEKSLLLGKVYLVLDQFDEALKLFTSGLQSAIKDSPEMLSLQTCMGDTLRKMGRYEEAAKQYESALNLAVNLFEAGDSIPIDLHISLGEIMLEIFKKNKRPYLPYKILEHYNLATSNMTKSAASFVIAKKSEAQQIMMRESFGKVYWEEYFGDVGVEPPLPKNINEILNGPCPFWANKKVQDTHVLVLIPKTINGQPMTLSLLYDLVSNPKKGNLAHFSVFLCHHYHGLAAKFVREVGKIPVGKSHWVLMTRKAIPDIFDIRSPELRNYPTYRIPKSAEAAICILLQYIAYEVRLFPGTMREDRETPTYCEEVVDKSRMAIGEFSKAGLRLEYTEMGLMGGEYAVQVAGRAIVQGIGSAIIQTGGIADAIVGGVIAHAAPGITYEGKVGVALLREFSGTGEVEKIELPSEEPAAKETKGPSAISSQMSISIPKIKLSVPKEAFGVDKWKELVGPVGAEPPLPENIEDLLNSPCPFCPGKTVRETHALTLIPQTLNGQPFTLANLIKHLDLLPKKMPIEVKYFESIYKYAKAPVEAPYWILMTREILPKSGGMKFNDYLDVLKEYQKENIYRAPLAIEVFATILLPFMLNGTRLFSKPTSYTWCEDKDRFGDNLYIGDFNNKLKLNNLRITFREKGITPLLQLNKYDARVTVALLKEFSGTGEVEKIELPSEETAAKETSATSPQISVSTLKVKVSVPKEAFGADKWKELVGPVGEEPPLPENIENLLNSPCPFWPGKSVKETHVLVLIPQTLNGQEFTLQYFIKQLYQLTKKVPLNDKGDSVLVFSKNAKAPVKAPYWILMTREILPKSRGKKFAESTASLTDYKQEKIYRTPYATEAFASVVLPFLLDDTRLFGSKPTSFTWCEEKKGNDNLSIGGFKKNLELHPYSSSLNKEEMGITPILQLNK